jgi:hypothetical protein
MRGLLSYRHERSWPGGASYQIGFAHKTGPADRSTDLLWDVRGHGLHFLGFGYSNSILAPGGGFKVVVPYWFVALLFATVFAGSVVVRRRGRPVGTCSSCGYDLRATPNRCPECGAKPLPAKGAAA